LHALAEIAAVGRALPPNRYEQEELIGAARALWAERHANARRVDDLHRAVQVGGRNLALPLERYPELASFGEANDAFIRVATDLAEQALREALDAAGLAPRDLDALFFVTVTGVAAPTIDARLVNRLGLRPDVKRTPIFGLGCVAGAAGVARVADYLKGYPRHAAALVSAELCSLTLQREDLSVANLIASGLFGDAAAAVVLTGAERPRARSGPAVIATRSSFYPDTERVMGWDVGANGFKVVLAHSVPDVVRANIGRDVDGFLFEHGLERKDIATWVCHPGGPKVLEAFQESLGLERDDLGLTWRSLHEVGNLSSASVLFVLGDTIRERRPPPGAHGLMIAMGPGFCSELVLLRW
jgi:alkylresorcinol/alkylpyrone synthase